MKRFPSLGTLVDSLVVFFATGCGISLLPYQFRKQADLTGGGFFGSLLGLVTFFALPHDPQLLSFALLGFLLISIVVGDRAEELFKRKDDPRIVIDEWIGVWVAFAFLPRTWPYAIGALLLFRVFDVWKGFGIRSLQSIGGGLGVVLDDVLAGIYSNVILQIIRKVADHV